MNTKTHQQTLLVSSSSHTFLQVFGTLIPRLAQRFKVVLLISKLQSNVSASLIETLDSWKREQIIEIYYLVPPQSRTLKFHSFMNGIISDLRFYHFNVWLTRTEIHVGDRYVSSCVLEDHCKRIVVSPLISYLLRDVEKMKALFPDRKSSTTTLPSGSVRRLQKLFTMIKEIRSFSQLYSVMGKIVTKIMQRVGGVFKIAKLNLIDRKLFPWLLQKKAFNYSPFDLITMLGSGTADAYIFSDQVEADAHQKLFQTNNIHVALNPSINWCSCTYKDKKPALLVPLSGWESETKLSEENLLLHYRDLKSVINETGVKEVHLRIHPSFTTLEGWAPQLMEYLKNKGINARIVDCQRPIREVVCDYLCVAGFASGALRDARACCQNVLVIGFTALSLKYFKEPKLVFGQSEGIGWIEEDGRYKADIFSRTKFTPKAQKTISDIVFEVSGVTIENKRQKENEYSIRKS